MTVLEIILLVAGGTAFISSFFLPDKGGEKAQIPEEELERLVGEEIEKNRGRIEDMTEETVNYSVEKAERSLDRLTNEKMLALGEYSDNILNQIGNNHQEVVFLHDMLNRSKNELEDLLNRAERESREAHDRADAAYSLAESAHKLAGEVLDRAEAADRTALAAEEKMLDARRLSQDLTAATVFNENDLQEREIGTQGRELEELVRNAAALSGQEASFNEETFDEPVADEPSDELIADEQQDDAVVTDELMTEELKQEADKDLSGAEEDIDPMEQMLKEALAEVKEEAASEDEEEEEEPFRGNLKSSSEEELQALLDNAINTAAGRPVPEKKPESTAAADDDEASDDIDDGADVRDLMDIIKGNVPEEKEEPAVDPMAVDPAEEKFFEDTQQKETEEYEEPEELSEEEMMEKLLREATAELAHDVSRVTTKKDIPAVKDKGDDEEDIPPRTSVKRKMKPRSLRKAEEDEIEGQMSIPEEFMPSDDKKPVAGKEASAAEDSEANEDSEAKEDIKESSGKDKSAKSKEVPDKKPGKNSVSLQFGHEDLNSANHNERILEMHRMGRSNMAIAKDLGLGIGEVKLVIDLFENMNA